MGKRERLDGERQMREVERYKLLCDQMFAVDRRVRYATVFDEECSIVAGGMRPGVKPIELPERSQIVDLQVGVLAGVVKTWSEDFGPTRFIFFKHEKINTIVFPIDNKHLATTTQPDFPLEDVGKMLRVLERWRQT